MAVQLKPLNEQVILITGASSGIGLITAKRAAGAGAKVILVARNAEALDRATAEINASGGEAVYAVADVGNLEQLKSAAETGASRFGRIDTWVNNAGTGMYTDIATTDIADDKRLFETNFWGIVNGSRLAVPYLRQNGGALINLGSEVSDVAIPVQGMYAASKHAVLGFTDALRTELEAAGEPISVTLIKPAAINTPFPEHAKNNTDQVPTLPAPVYAPELVADQILHAAVNPVRDLYVGGGGRLLASLGQHLPRVMDWISEKFMIGQQLKDGTPDHSAEGLHESRGGHRVSGDVDQDHHVRTTSLYGVASRNPTATALVTVGVAAVAAYFLLKPASPPPTVVERAKKAGRSFADAIPRDYVKPLSRVVRTAREQMAHWR